MYLPYHMKCLNLPLLPLFVLFTVQLACGQNNSRIADMQSPKAPALYDSLVWSDEFDRDGRLDTSKWFLQTKLPPWGEWFGGLINHYTDRPENAHVLDGFLHLVARKEAFHDQGHTKEYTSARLNSKFTFTYGRLEVRAKVPEGIGTWPAIWMLNRNISEDGAYWQTLGYGTTSWPTCGEIDILEHWGKNRDYIQSAVHTASSFGDKVINLGGRDVEDVTNQFHVYELNWSPEKLTFSVDGIAHYSYQPEVKNAETWPFNDPYYIIFNIAIERDIDPDFMESAMIVDYVRVYQ